MGVSFEKFSFTKITTVASQEINLTGAFQPKALILWTNGNTGTVFQEHYNWSFGFSDGTTDACVSSESEDNAGSALYKNVIRNDAIIWLYDEAQVNISKADVTSFDADGFTLNWSVNGSGNPAAIIHGIAIGGTDITNVIVDLETAGTTATGNKAYTGAGFQADFGMFIADWDSYNVQSTSSNNMIIGCAKSTTKRWCVDCNTEGAATMDTWGYHRNDKCMVMLSQTGAVDEEADFVSFDTNGVTFNWTNAPGFTTDAIAMLLIKGGQWDAGTFTQRDNTGSQAITTAGIDTHKGAFFATHGDVLSTSGTAQSHHRLSVGGADGTRQGYATAHDTDAAGTSIIAKIQNTNGILRTITANATATSSTTQAQADFTSFSANTITINYSVADTADRIVSWWAVGEAVTGTQFNRSPSAENVTVSDASTTRILSALRVPSADSVTVTAGTSTRMISATRVPSADSTTVADASLTRSKTWMGVPSADSTTVSDVSTTRMLSAVRVPSTENPALSENLTRTISATRVPSSDSTTVSDASVTRSFTANRVPSTDTVTPTDVSTTQIITRVRAPSADTVTPTDASLTRMTQAFRVPSSDSVTVGESLSGGKLLERAPSSDSITVADSSLTRLLSASRQPSADDITTGENLTRILSAIRSPSSDSTVVSDVSTTQSLTRGRSTQESVTIVDSSLTRMLSATRVPTTEVTTVIDSSLTRIYSALRIPSADSVTTSENITGQVIQPGQFNRSPATENVTVGENLTRMLSTFRVPSSDTVTIVEDSLTRSITRIRTVSTDTVVVSAGTVTRVKTAIRLPSTDTTDVVEQSLTRLLQLFRVPSSDTVTVGESLTGGKVITRAPSTDNVTVSAGTVTRIMSAARSVAEETTNVIESSLVRLLMAMRSPSVDTVSVSELQSLISHSRSIQDTVAVTEPVLTRIVTAIRSLGPEFVDVSEQVFFQTWHRFVFDSVIVADTLFAERQQLSGPVTYATPDEVRPLLGNLGSQRTDTQIQLAIDSAYDEINRKTSRLPPSDWKDTDADFSIIKKLTRMKAALEMSIGIKDFEDREWMQKEINEMFMLLEEHDTGGALSNDMVISSEDETYALNETGIIWSTRYKNLRKTSSTGENDTTINPNT
jgi:hypothetical protein